MSDQMHVQSKNEDFQIYLLPLTPEDSRLVQASYNLPQQLVKASFLSSLHVLANFIGGLVYRNKFQQIQQTNSDIVTLHVRSEAVTMKLPLSLKVGEVMAIIGKYNRVEFFYNFIMRSDTKKIRDNNINFSNIPIRSAPDSYDAFSKASYPLPKTKPLSNPMPSESLQTKQMFQQNQDQRQNSQGFSLFSNSLAGLPPSLASKLKLPAIETINIRSQLEAMLTQQTKL